MNSEESDFQGSTRFRTTPFGVGHEMHWNYQLRLPLLAMYDPDSLLWNAAFIHVPICHYSVRYPVRLPPTTVGSWWSLSQRYRHWSDYTLCSQTRRHFPLIAGYQLVLQRPGSQEPLCAFFLIFAYRGNQPSSFRCAFDLGTGILTN